MNKNQENKRNMYLSVLTFLDTQKHSWQDFSAFSNAVDRFRVVTHKIGEFSQTQSSRITGVTEDKLQIRNMLEKLVLQVCNKLAAYSNFTQNNTLKEKSFYTLAKLRLQRDTILVDTANYILGLANSNLANMVDYNLTPNMLSVLQNKINEFNTALNQPRQHIVTRKGVTKQISLLFKEADNILKGEIDLLIIDFSFDKPEFERDYKNARIIIDLGVRRRVEKDSDIITSLPPNNIPPIGN